MKEEKEIMQHYNYLSATGKLRYNMTNDYMFRIVLQRDKETLIGLICSILHLSREQVTDAYIDNPITPGDTLDSKEYQMDIVVVLNENTLINLEMQVINYNNWPIRSLVYLCRKFDNVSRGKDYNTVKSVYHIGFHDFTLFEEHPEFFATYQVRNAIDNFPYTDKFNLLVIELNHTEIATNEDKLYGIDKWAKLFKATTWEEIKMITKENPSLNSAAESIYKSNADEYVIEACLRREEQLAHEKYQQEQIENLTNENARLRKLLEDNGIKA